MNAADPDVRQRPARFAPGPALLMAGPACTVLLISDRFDELRPGLWETVGGGAGLAATAEQLLAQSADAVPTFAVLGEVADGVGIIARGNIRLTVEGPDGPAVLRPRAGEASLEHHVAGSGSVRVDLEGVEVDVLSYAIAGGIAPAGAVEVGLAAEASPLVPQVGMAAVAVPRVPAGAPAAATPEDGLTRRWVEPEASIVPTAATAVPVTAAAVVTAAEAGADGADYDHLFGETQMRSVEGAAVRGEGTEEHLPGTQPSSPMPEPDRSEPPHRGVGDVVDGAPADHDGMTITSEELRALRDEIPSNTQTGTTTARRANVPTVHAVRCPAAHLNPPHAPSCRVCGAQVPEQAHLSLPRPLLGTFRFSTGQQVEVSRPMLIGRSPKAAGALTGEFPELVTVPSPQHDVSRVHVEVRLEGWQVLVIDCGSTNGTIITLPGRQPQLLRAGEPHPIVPGSSVNLGGEVTFWFEAEG